MEKFTEIYFGLTGAAEAVIGYHYFSRLSGRNCFFRISRRDLTVKSIFRYVSAALIIFTVMQLCFGAADSVIGILSPVIIGKNPDLTALLMILLNLFSVFAVCVCCEFIIKCCSYKFFDEKNNFPDAVLFLIPLVMICGIGMYINRIIYGNTACVNDVEKVSEKAIAMLAFQAAGLAAVFCILKILGETVKNRLETEYASLRAEKAEFRCERTRAFRHDVKNHMTVLTEFLARGNIQGAEKYLSELKIISEEFSFRFLTGRPAADILINSKLSEAEKMGIDISCEISIPRSEIKDSDLCIILANAVDNAVHACEKLGDDTRKFIEIRGNFHENIFLTEVRNSFGGERFKKGTGLKNIEYTAKKYGGSVRINCTENVFTLQVIMQNFISQH